MAAAEKADLPPNEDLERLYRDGRRDEARDPLGEDGCWGRDVTTALRRDVWHYAAYALGRHHEQQARLRGKDGGGGS